MKIINSLLDHTTPWLCYRAPATTDLIYFSCNKCASTLYDQLFEKLEWNKITTADIDWNNDFVFSYIRNPVVRHRKGIVEGIFSFYPYMKQVFNNNLQHLEFLANITSIEPHSYSIHRMLGDNALKMHWLPIDTEVDHKQETFNLLKTRQQIVSKEVKNWFMSLEKANESSLEELNFYNQLSNIQIPPEILRYLDFDICLYDKIITPAPHIIAPQYYSDRIHALQAQGISQQHAEEIVDEEVYKNKHIK